MSYPTYPEEYRFPPRASHTIQHGVMLYFGALYYVRGMGEEQIATHVANGLVEFVEYWNIPPVLVLVAMLVVMVWVIWDHLGMIGRYSL